MPKVFEKYSDSDKVLFENFYGCACLIKQSQLE